MWLRQSDCVSQSCVSTQECFRLPRQPSLTDNYQGQMFETHYCLKAACVAVAGYWANLEHWNGSRLRVTTFRKECDRFALATWTLSFPLLSPSQILCLWLSHPLLSLLFSFSPASSSYTSVDMQISLLSYKRSRNGWRPNWIECNSVHLAGTESMGLRNGFQTTQCPPLVRGFSC